MKGVVDCFDCSDLYCFGQVGVEGADEFFGCVFPVGVEVEALPVRMYAGIGAATALDLCFRGKNLREGGFDYILHSFAAGLALPAVKVCAVVGACAFPSHIWKDSCQCDCGCKAALRWSLLNHGNIY